MFFHFGKAQKIADKSYYLVDSLDLTTLNTADSLLIDTTLTSYYNTTNDTVRIKKIQNLIEQCSNDIWVKYNEYLLNEIQQRIDKGIEKQVVNVFYQENLSFTYNNLGYFYFNKNNSKKAINAFTKAIEISESVNKKEVIPTALNNIGYLYKLEGNILKALDYYHKSLKLYRTLKMEKDIALSLNNIGAIYYSHKEYGKALKYYREALIIQKRGGSKKGEARIYGNIGSIYIEQNRIENAIEYLNYSVKKYKEIDDEKGMANSLSKLAFIELQELDLNQDNTLKLTEILSKQQRVLNIYIKYKKDKGRADILSGMALTHKASKNYRLAEKYAIKSLKIAQELGFASTIQSSSEILKGIYKIEKKYKEAYAMQELFYTMQDSLSNKFIKEKTIQKQYQYEYEKQHFTDSLATNRVQEVKAIEYEQSIKQQKIYTIIGLIGLFLMLIIALSIYRGLQIKKKSNVLLVSKNQEIEQKNIEITDSIAYAKHIQDSILPSVSTFKKVLKEFFVFYQPKDIVAGDFYWLEEVDGLVLFAAADCTGHGVPGALVSVVCNNALNRAVKENRITEPAKILNVSSQYISEAFNASEKGIKIRDGMDIALCAIDYASNILHFSGANNPLYIIRKGMLIEIKGDKKSIGNASGYEFTNHIIPLEKNDMIYLFSDGYADQFGGVKGKKFMYKKFKTLLASIAEKNVAEQQIIIENTFLNWKGDTFQVDDICVVGVRV